MLSTFPPSSPVGSVLPCPVLPGAEAHAGLSLWSLWTSPHRKVAAYGCARAALAALLACRRIRRVWLPAYCCPSLVEGVGAVEIAWYGVDRKLSPDVGALSAGLRLGDAVLSISYFGLPSSQTVQDLASRRPDVLWIEDRSQAADPGGPAWADVHLHSPRKLVGVADGGILTSDGCLPVPVGTARACNGAAQTARRDDPQGLRHDLWYRSFQQQEAAFGPGPSPMTPETRWALERIDAHAVCSRRIANAAELHAHVQGVALWPHMRPGVPLLAVPIRVDDPSAVAAALAMQGVYCARHWASLPSDPERFPQAHFLSAELLSLPCDQHYDRGHMRRVAAALRGLGLLPRRALVPGWDGRHVPRAAAANAAAL